ncbi:hypothetical protein WDW37_19500 [Bdellovibrionota bacterium FG-1]
MCTATSLIRILFVMGAGASVFSACTNSGAPRKPTKPAARASGTPGSSTEASANVLTTDPALTYRVSSTTLEEEDSNPVPAPSSTANAPAPTVNIFLNADAQASPFSYHCNTVTGASAGGQTAKPCNCEYTWQEVNQTGAKAIAVPRLVRTPVLVAQPNLVSCKAPSMYHSEIPDGTLIKLDILPAPGNGDKFVVKPYTLTKALGAVAGAFQDEKGNTFDNVLRYSCYEQFKRGMSIQSKVVKVSDTGTSGMTAKIPMASQFCVRKAGGGGSDCEGLGQPENSAQAYYYNLFIRNSENGDINYNNGRYICPRVQESLVQSAVSGTKGTQGLAWPLDSSFAVSLNPSPDFSVGIEAFTKLASLGTDKDPTAVSSGCFNNSASGGGAASGGETASGGFVKSCLGFAAPPSAAGQCPAFKDSSGQVRRTYRLRRYVALFPPAFDTDGKPLAQAQSVDTIFVVDRPVKNPADPLKEFTMLGPKPCNFAYFDHKKVTNASMDPTNQDDTQHYVATNSSLWFGKNVDGIELPNTYVKGASCPAVVPVLSDDRSTFALISVKKNDQNVTLDHLYVRPIRPWAPHYEEDTDFQACVPLASPLRDPPLHFQQVSPKGNLAQAWCAEAYPTQNDNFGEIAKKVTTDAGGKTTVKYDNTIHPYTSHGVKNTAKASECSSTPMTFPSNVTGLEPVAKKTDLCDRTVVAGSLDWPRFPLLAPSDNVELMMVMDSSYQCTLTYDAGGGRTGRGTPAAGCCAAGVLKNGTAETPVGAHLEPGTECGTPAY